MQNMEIIYKDVADVFEIERLIVMWDLKSFKFGTILCVLIKGISRTQVYIFKVSGNGIENHGNFHGMAIFLHMFGWKHVKQCAIGYKPTYISENISTI